MTKTEITRLATVRRFEHLKLNENKELNDLVFQITKICKVSMASLTIMDEDVQWLKCSSGLAIRNEKIEDSFCKHLINTHKVMVVPDALLDVRFVNYPSVTGGMKIRFYAGVPLITTTGYHLGALCVFGTEPGNLSSKQREMLAFIGRQVMHMMEMLLGIDRFKQHHSELDAQKEKAVVAAHNLKTFFNSSNTCHLLINKALHVLDFNKATSLFVKKLYSTPIASGKNVLQFISHSFKKEFLRSIKKAFTGKATRKEILMDIPDHGSQWWDIKFQPVTDALGNTVNVAYSATNIHEQKVQLAENIAQSESLLEIAHIQSHGYRKPVASILGLMNVIKQNNYKSPRKCLMLMEKAVKELDDKIRSIVGITQKAS